jgi:hypothetical protein
VRAKRHNLYDFGASGLAPPTKTPGAGSAERNSS